MVDVKNVQVVGEVLSAQGTNPYDRATPLSSKAVTEILGRYFLNNYSGRTYYCYNSAAQALSANNTTTYTGFCLTNPANSKEIVALDEIFLAETALSAAAGFPFYLNAQATVPTAQTTPLTPKCATIGNKTSPQALVASAVTLAANPTTVDRLLGVQISTSTLPTNYEQVMAPVKDDVNGALILLPGTCVCISSTLTATLPSVLAGMTWDELPIPPF